MVVDRVHPAVPEQPGDLLGPAVGRGVDDAGAARRHRPGAGGQRRCLVRRPARPVDLFVVRLAVQGQQHLPDQLVPLGVRRADQVDAEPDVRPVGVPDDHRGVPHAQPVGDLRPDPGRGGRGQREHPPDAEGADGAAETEVVRPEVVAPLADAVRLVHHRQRDRRAAQPGEDLGVGQLLRCEQQELDPPGGEVLDGLPALPGRQRGVEHRRALPGRVQGAQLVVLQRDGRTDHQGGALDQHGGDRVDQRLAGPGGEHGQRVPLAARPRSPRPGPAGSPRRRAPRGRRPGRRRWSPTDATGAARLDRRDSRQSKRSSRNERRLCFFEER